MNLKDLEKNILEENNKDNKKRNQLITNLLNLSVNTGKINKNADYILYSENSKEEKKEKIKETEEYLYQIIKNVVNIANSLELSIEEICSKINTNK